MNQRHEQPGEIVDWLGDCFLVEKELDHGTRNATTIY